MRTCRDRRVHEVMIAEKHMRPAVVERAISGWVSNRAWGEGKIWFGAPCVWPGRRV